MRIRRHPLSGAVYEVTEDGLIRVVDDNGSGLFRADGTWVSGEVTVADPQLCGWLAGPQVTRSFGGSQKDLPVTGARS